MNHTPEPYRAEKFAIKAIDHGQWYTIARTMSSKLTDEGNRNNAEFIVRAVNAYDKLLTDMDEATGVIEWVIERYPELKEGDLGMVHATLCETVAKAKGGGD